MYYERWSKNNARCAKKWVRHARVERGHAVNNLERCCGQATLGSSTWPSPAALSCVEAMRLRLTASYCILYRRSLYYVTVSERVEFVKDVAAFAWSSKHNFDVAYTGSIYSIYLCSTLVRLFCISSYMSVSGIYQQLRSASQNILLVPRYKRSGLGRRAFSVAGPLVWNSIADCLHDPALELASFKRQLKTFLFARY